MVFANFEKGRFVIALVCEAANFVINFKDLRQKRATKNTDLWLKNHAGFIHRFRPSTAPFGIAQDFPTEQNPEKNEAWR